MKPARFDYVAARSIDETTRLLASHADAKVIAGGQSLLPLLNLRLARCERLIDIGHIAELDEVTVTTDTLLLGALVRHARLEHDEQIRVAQPMLSRAAAHIGHRAIRNHGTIGGSIAHADPSAELPATLVALGGSVLAASTAGRREIHASELFVNHFETSLEDDELVTHVRLPLGRPGLAWGFYEYAPRPGDFAHAGAIVTVEHASGGSFADDARCVDVTWFATNSTPTKVDVDGLDGVDSTQETDIAEATADSFTSAYERTGGDVGKQRLAVTVATRAFREAMRTVPVAVQGDQTEGTN